MAVMIKLSETRTAQVETDKYGADRPVLVVFENGRRTPGQWFAETIAARTPSTPISIDFGAGWNLTTGESALLFGFAVGVLAASKVERPVHTVRGKAIGPEGVPYGTTHDMDCPACQGTPFTASPRSETYWAS